MHTVSGPQWRQVFSPRPDDASSVLRELEGLLVEQLRVLGGASYRRRLEIENELCEIRRELERLARFAPSS